MLMKRNMVLILAVGLMMLVLVPNVTESAAAAATTGPAPAADCSSLVLTMADCLSFVTNGSTEEKPEGTCCSGLKSVLKTDSQCVCEAFKNSAQLGVTLNLTKALSLPSACHVSAPSLTSCGVSVGPGTAPAISPVAAVSPSSSTAAAPTDNGGLGNEVSAPAPTPIPGSGSGATSSSSAIAFAASSLLMAVMGMHLSLV